MSYTDRSRHIYWFINYCQYKTFVTLNHFYVRSRHPSDFPVLERDFFPFAHRVVLYLHLASFVQDEQTGAALAGRATHGDARSHDNGLIPLRQRAFLLGGKYVAQDGENEAYKAANEADFLPPRLLGEEEQGR